MKDYYNIFIQCSMSRCLSFDDLIDKKRLRIHNKAMDQLSSLQKEMFMESDKCAGITHELLIHEDERVRIGAGAYCIHAQILIEEGVNTLIEIRDNSKSKYMRVSAGQNLDYCMPF